MHSGTEEVGSSDDASDVYLEGAQFELWSRHQLSSGNL
jgi:hypothetical protein